MTSLLPAFAHKIWFRLALCLPIGAFGALGLPPLTTPALIVSLSVYWLILSRLEGRFHILAAGFLFGFGYFLAGLWWVGNALLVGGNPYLWALPLAVAGLQALLALFPMAATVTSQMLFPGRSLSSYCAFIASLSFWEWGRGHFFTGFPWNLYGMTWTEILPVLQSLSLFGIYGLSLLTIFMASVPAFAVYGQASRSVRGLLFGLALLVGGGLYSWGDARLKSLPSAFNHEVLLQLVTPDIPQEEKWNSSLFWDNYLRTVDRIVEPGVADAGKGTAKLRLVLLPETALHYSFKDNPLAVERLRSILKGFPEKTYLLSGILRRTSGGKSGEDDYHNSLSVFDDSLTEKATFDKFHLVPFGEYIPFQRYIPFGPVVAFSGFRSGPGPQTLRLDDIPPFSPLVCYEVIFPGAVTAATGKDGSRPAWILNVTNDAWYGISPGPWQHLGHAVYRAIEEGLPVARATNTGISAIIDPVGRILTESPLFEPFVQTTPLPTPLPTLTWYSRFKDLPFFFALILLYFPSVRAFFRKKTMPR